VSSGCWTLCRGNSTYDKCCSQRFSPFGLWVLWSCFKCFEIAPRHSYSIEE